ncbi:MAG: hypothetical protein ABIP13_03520 [Tepidiformaceae bacterium]
MQQGRLAAADILASISGKRPRRFHYRDKETMATVGKGAAVAQVGKLHLTGFAGWLSIWGCRA